MKCPACGKKLVPAGSLFRCENGHFFDDDPSEGSDVSDRDPAARLMAQEAAKQRADKRIENRIGQRTRKTW